MESSVFKTATKLMLLTIFATACCIAHAAPANSEFSGSEGVQALTTFFGTYCASCHGKKEPEGDLILSRIEYSKWSKPKFAIRILKHLEERKMPPDDAQKQLPDDDRAAAIEILTGHLNGLKPEPRGDVLIRLNKTEYENTINDVFGTKLKLRDMLPPDSDPEEGFANVGERLFISPGSVEHYMNLGIKLSERLMRSNPTGINRTYLPGGSELFVRTKSNVNKKTHAELKRLGAMPLSLCLRVDVPEPGYYEISLNGIFFARPPNIKEPKPIEKVDIPGATGAVYHKITESAGREPASFARGGHKADIRKPFRVYLTPGRNVLIVGDTYVRTASGEFITTPPKPKKNEPPTILPKLHVDKDGKSPSYSTWIESLTLKGPVYDTWPPEEEKAYTYIDDRQSSHLDKVKASIKTLADKLYRMPTSEADLQPLYAIGEFALREKGNVYDAVQASLGAMLCSPQFLYKYSSKSGQLDDYAIASRLSHFLWNTLPDEQILSLAAAGKLQDPEVRRQQAIRMIKDERSNRFVHDFTHQWLDMHKLPAISPNKHLFPADQFTPELHKEMELEPIEFFKVVLHENLSVDNFIDSDFIVATPRLQALYTSQPQKKRGKGSTLGEFKKMPATGGTGGLLTQRGFLLMTSDGEMTNPIYRGVWVLKNLYGKKMVLDNAPEAIPTDVNTSIRAKLADHRKTTNCAVCHNHIDPIGLAMEGIDVMGRPRTHYVEIKETKTIEEYEKKGKILTREVFKYDLIKHDPVDDADILDDGRKVQGIDGLKKALMADKDEIAKALIGKLFTYALGREHDFHDRAAIDGIHGKIASRGTRLQDMIVELVASDAFTKR